MMSAYAPKKKVSTRPSPAQKMNIFVERFPETVEIFGESYRIVTDFRDWIKYTEMYGATELSAREKVQLSRNGLSTCPPYCRESLDALKWFLLMGEEQKPSGKKTDLFHTSRSGVYCSGIYGRIFKLILTEVDLCIGGNSKHFLRG